MGTFDNLRAKAEKLTSDNPDKVESISDQVIEKGGDAVDRATGGRHAEHVDKAQRMADEKVGRKDASAADDDEQTRDHNPT